MRVNAGCFARNRRFCGPLQGSLRDRNYRKLYGTTTFDLTVPFTIDCKNHRSTIHPSIFSTIHILQILPFTRYSCHQKLQTLYATPSASSPTTFRMPGATADRSRKSHYTVQPTSIRVLTTAWSPPPGHRCIFICTSIMGNSGNSSSMMIMVYRQPSVPKGVHGVVRAYG